MLKMFCDVCGKEMKDTSRLRRVRLGVIVEVMVGVKEKFSESWNTNHVCHDCVIHIVQHGKDVPEL